MMKKTVYVLFFLVVLGSLAAPAIAQKIGEKITIETMFYDVIFFNNGSAKLIIGATDATDHYRVKKYLFVVNAWKYYWESAQKYKLVIKLNENGWLIEERKLIGNESWRKKSPKQ